MKILRLVWNAHGEVLKGVAGVDDSSVLRPEGCFHICYTTTAIDDVLLFWNEVKFFCWNFSSWFSSIVTSRTNFRLKNILQIAKTMTLKWLVMKQQRRQLKQKIMILKIQIVTALVHIHQVSVRNEGCLKEVCLSLSVMIIFQHTQYFFLTRSLSSLIFDKF